MVVQVVGASTLMLCRVAKARWGARSQRPREMMSAGKEIKRVCYWLMWG